MTRGTKATDRDPLAPARRLALFRGEIIAAASVRPPFVWNDSALPCRRRPKRRRCPGRLRVREKTAGQVEWACPVCGDGGLISGWQGSSNDLRHLRQDGEHTLLTLVLTEEEYDLLRQCMLLDEETMAVVYGATVSPTGIVLRASAEDLELLDGQIAFEANHTPNRKHQRALDGILDRIALVQQPPTLQLLRQRPDKWH